MDERNFQFMFYGLGAAWALLALYAVSLAGRGSKIRRQIEDLKKMIEEKKQ
jgi:CcmD family protein